MAKEPIPDKTVCFTPGTFILSAYGTIVYEILSYPLCRLYPQHENDPDLSDVSKSRLKFSTDGYAFVPWKTESAWYEHSDPRKGWVRDGANFPSYLVCIWMDGLPLPTNLFITLRWKPSIAGSYDEAVLLKQSVQDAAVTLDTTIKTVSIPEHIVSRIRATHHV